MRPEKLILALSLIVVIVIAAVSMVFPVEDKNTENIGTNPENAGLVCEIIGYTDAVEAGLNGSEPVPEYITEKYGTIYVPPDVMEYDLVELRDLGLKQDNSTVLPTRIYDVEYSLNYTFVESRMLENGLIVDSYYCIIRYINDSESAGALLFEFGDYAEDGHGLYRQEINFQSQYDDEFSIHILPVQETESAMSSPEPLYIVYSSKDVDHNYTPPLPELPGEKS